MSMPTTKSTVALQNIFRLYKYATQQKPGKDSIIISMVIWISTTALKLISNLIYSNIHYVKKDFWLLWTVITPVFFSVILKFLRLCRSTETDRLQWALGPSQRFSVALNLPAPSKTLSALTESACHWPPDRFLPLLISHLREKRRAVLFSNK